MADAPAYLSPEDRALWAELDAKLQTVGVTQMTGEDMSRYNFMRSRGDSTGEDAPLGGAITGVYSWDPKTMTGDLPPGAAGIAKLVLKAQEPDSAWLQSVAASLAPGFVEVGKMLQSPAIPAVGAIAQNIEQVRTPSPDFPELVSEAALRPITSAAVLPPREFVTVPGRPVIRTLDEASVAAQAGGFSPAVAGVGLVAVGWILHKMGYV